MKRRIIPIQASSENASSEGLKYEIPVKWEMTATLRIPARSLKEAVQIVNRRECDIPEGTFVDDSYEIDYDRLEE